MISRALVRRFSTSLRRFDDYPIEGRIGGNLPFNLNSKWKIFTGIAVAASVGFTIPFYIVYLRNSKE